MAAHEPFVLWQIGSGQLMAGRYGDVFKIPGYWSVHGGLAQDRGTGNGERRAQSVLGSATACMASAVVLGRGMCCNRFSSRKPTALA